jgi:hypothetical protein
MSIDFQALAGVALIVLALTGPLAYCTAKTGGPTDNNSLHLACINAKGEWKKAGGAFSDYTCIFPKTQP